jgi:hypothetical protein
VRVYAIFLLAGMVPPVSAFFHLLLTEYGILLADLHPNSVMLLAIF